MRRFWSNPTVEDPPTPPHTTKNVAYITTSHHHHLHHIDLDQKETTTTQKHQTTCVFLTAANSTPTRKKITKPPKQHNSQALDHHHTLELTTRQERGSKHFTSQLNTNNHHLWYPSPTTTKITINSINHDLRSEITTRRLHHHHLNITQDSSTTPCITSIRNITKNKITLTSPPLQHHQPKHFPWSPIQKTTQIQIRIWLRIQTRIRIHHHKPPLTPPRKPPSPPTKTSLKATMNSKPSPPKNQLPGTNYENPQRCVLLKPPKVTDDDADTHHNKPEPEQW